MTPLASWEKVLLGGSVFLDSYHGRLGCTVCHGGDSSVGYSTDEDYQAAIEDEELARGYKESAHTEDLVSDPSDTACSACHEDHIDTASTNAVSLHTTVSGMENALELRGGDLTEGSVLAEAFHNHCAECHSSCGQCHVSRPDMADGGFIFGHLFQSPDMTNNCVACHGARIGNEYLGKNLLNDFGDDDTTNDVYYDADVHYETYNMSCFDCHSSELHDTGDANTRYENCNAVSCVDSGCHDDILTDSNTYHQQHVYLHQGYDEGDTSLQCQVCHSTTYKNCYSCHANAETGTYSVNPDNNGEGVMDFEIGLNPLSSQPYDYVVLRHAPISIDTFEEYGANLLTDFDALETWKYATPHNIQKNTPQTATCATCHDSTDIFLTDDDVSAAEKTANEDVIVD